MTSPSDRPTCATCRYFVEHYLRPAQMHGTCRARPPLANVANFQLKWPEVDGREWCGDHALSQIGSFAGLRFFASASVPAGELHLVQDGKIVAKIVGIGEAKSEVPA